MSAPLGERIRLQQVDVGLRAALLRAQRTGREDIDAAGRDIVESHRWCRLQLRPAQEDRTRESRHLRRLKREPVHISRQRQYREYFRAINDPDWTAQAIEERLEDLELLLRAREVVISKRTPRRRGVRPNEAGWQLLWDLAVSLYTGGFSVRGHADSVLHQVVSHLRGRGHNQPDYTAQTKPIAKLFGRRLAELESTSALITSWRPYRFGSAAAGPFLELDPRFPQLLVEPRTDRVPGTKDVEVWTNVLHPRGSIGHADPESVERAIERLRRDFRRRLRTGSN